jgi:NAD(P)-dependent dehydrogenase (short-subunit alcohol dehydrogenase family)
VAEFGRLDILVTNAGILRDKVLWKMTDEDFDAVIGVHLRAPSPAPAPPPSGCASRARAAR